MKRAHTSILTNKILQSTFKDTSMLLYLNPFDPFKEFINYTLAAKSEDLQYDILNKTAYIFNPQTCDLNEADIIYEIDYSNLDITFPISLTGNILYNDIYVKYPIYTVQDVEEFNNKYPTRVEYVKTINLSLPGHPLGIIYAHTPTNRDGYIYITTDINPLYSGSLCVCDCDFNITNSGSLSRINTYTDDLYYCINDNFTWYGVPHNSGTYVLPFYVDSNAFKIYDIVHLNHANLPILIDSSEYILSYSGTSTIITFLGTESGRSTYNPNYYESPIEQGQPDQYWSGRYVFNFVYTPFITISNGLGTYGYFHELPYDNVLIPCVPDEITVEIPFELAKTTTHNSDEILISIAPKFIRPGNNCIVDLYFTQKITAQWANIDESFIYQINDNYLYDIAVESIKININSIPIENPNDVIINNNIVIINPTESFSNQYRSSTVDVDIYYRVHYYYEKETTPSYTKTSVNYKDDFLVDINGNIIPIAILSLVHENLNSDYANYSLRLYAKYNFAGIAYDPYRKTIWTYEKNNRYLSARDINDLSILQNISILKDQQLYPIIINDQSAYLIDYTIYNDIDVVSIKYLDGYLYLLASNNILYRIDMFYDKNGIDIEYENNNYIEYKFDPLYFNTTGDKTPVDFAFLKDLSICILFNDGSIDIYKTYYDFAIIDDINKLIGFRERYDEVIPLNIKPTGHNRITYLDQRAIEYMNELRYPGEKLHDFFKRLNKAYLPLNEKSYGYNSSKQGFYNFCSFAFNYDPKSIEHSTRHIYLKYNPIENDKNGHYYDIKVFVDGIEYIRIGLHENSIYDKFGQYLYDDKYNTNNFFREIDNGYFILWRNYNGNLTNHIELRTPTMNSVVDVVYNTYNPDGFVVTITETFTYEYSNIIYNQDELYDINSINKRHLWNSGVVYVNDQSLVEEYLNAAKRHWGYTILDKTTASDIFYEQRTVLICYNKINITGGL